MKSIFKKISNQDWLLFLAITLVALSSFSFVLWHAKQKIGTTAQAALYIQATDTGDNVEGFAWSSNVGWISFNSTDCDSDCTTAICTSEGAPGCPPAGTTFNDYGVKINSLTGNFSGYAWSSNVGWISFNRCGTDGNCSTVDGDTGTPPEPPFDGATGTIAQVNLDTHSLNYGQVTGWAKILALGDDGWIRLGYSTVSPPSFPISFPLATPFSIGDALVVDPVIGEFYGWAWNGNDNDHDGTPETGVGWINFNCKDYLTCSGGTDNGQVCDGSNCTAGGGTCVDTCTLSNYKVTANINTPPTIASTSEESNPCNKPLTYFLKWTFGDAQDAIQTGYEIQIRTLGSATWNVVNQTFNTSAQQYSFSPTYNTTYDWRVSVIDSGGLKSDPSPISTFSTPIHPYPNVAITWSPTSPHKNEEVTFGTSTSQIFDSSVPTIFWTFEHANIATATTSNPVVIFSQEGNINVTLNITDAAGFSCTSTPIAPGLIIGKGLPSWIER